MEFTPRPWVESKAAEVGPKPGKVHMSTQTRSFVDVSTQTTEDGVISYIRRPSKARVKKGIPLGAMFTAGASRSETLAIPGGSLRIAAPEGAGKGRSRGNSSGKKRRKKRSKSRPIMPPPPPGPGSVTKITSLNSPSGSISGTSGSSPSTLAVGAGSVRRPAPAYERPMPVIPGGPDRKISLTSKDSGTSTEDLMPRRGTRGSGKGGKGGKNSAVGLVRMAAMVSEGSQVAVKRRPSKKNAGSGGKSKKGSKRGSTQTKKSGGTGSSSRSTSTGTGDGFIRDASASFSSTSSASMRRAAASNRSEGSVSGPSKVGMSFRTASRAVGGSSESIDKEIARLQAEAAKAAALRETKLASEAKKYRESGNPARAPAPGAFNGASLGNLRPGFDDERDQHPGFKGMIKPASAKGKGLFRVGSLMSSASQVAHRPRTPSVPGQDEDPLRTASDVSDSSVASLPADPRQPGRRTTSMQAAAPSKELDRPSISTVKSSNSQPSVTSNATLKSGSSKQQPSLPSSASPNDVAMALAQTALAATQKRPEETRPPSGSTSKGVRIATRTMDDEMTMSSVSGSSQSEDESVRKKFWNQLTHSEAANPNSSYASLNAGDTNTDREARSALRKGSIDALAKAKAANEEKRRKEAAEREKIRAVEEARIKAEAAARAIAAEKAAKEAAEKAKSEAPPEIPKPPPGPAPPTPDTPSSSAQGSEDDSIRTQESIESLPTDPLPPSKKSSLPPSAIAGAMPSLGGGAPMSAAPAAPNTTRKPSLLQRLGLKKSASPDKAQQQKKSAGTAPAAPRPPVAAAGDDETSDGSSEESEDLTSDDDDSGSEEDIAAPSFHYQYCDYDKWGYDKWYVYEETGETGAMSEYGFEM